MTLHIGATVSWVSSPKGLAWMGFSSIKESFLWWVDIWPLGTWCNCHSLWQWILYICLYRSISVSTTVSGDGNDLPFLLQWKVVFIWAGWKEFCPSLRCCSSSYLRSKCVILAYLRSCSGLAFFILVYLTILISFHTGVFALSLFFPCCSCLLVCFFVELKIKPRATETLPSLKYFTHT